VDLAHSEVVMFNDEVGRNHNIQRKGGKGIRMNGKHAIL